MTIEQFFGFEATGSGNLSGTIENVGSTPIGVERFDASVTLRLTGSDPCRVIACDEHGYQRDTPIKTSGNADALTIQLDPVSAYHVITR